MAAVCVSVDQCKSWAKGGKTEFVRYCRGLLIGHKNVDGAAATKNVSRALYEACWHAVVNNLDLDHLLAALDDVTKLHGDVPSLLADVYSIIDTETLCNEKKEERERFINLVANTMYIVPDCLLKERLDLDTLETMGIIHSKQTFQQKYVKVKTKLYYKQQKFNLLREESEGYSKLVTELNQEFPEDTSCLDILENIKSLIGCFSLDPNRVLDVLLESFECRPRLASFFVPLLRSYMCNNDLSTICHMLGFKFHWCQRMEDGETPESLYKIAALLISHNLVDIDTFYPHLSPPDSDIQATHRRAITEAQQFASKLSIVVLSADKDDVDTLEDTKLDQNGRNQKVGVVEALLHIGDWVHARVLIDRLPPFFAVSHQPVAEAICKVIHHIIEPLYKRSCGLPSAILRKWTKSNLPDSRGLDQATTFSDLLKVAFPMLSYLGPHLSCDTLLMAKVLRLARAFMHLQKKQGSALKDGDDIFRGFLTLVDEALLPSLSLLPCNCCISEEVWSFLRLLKYEHRYRLYGQWKNESHVVHPKLIRARAEVINRAKYIMKRLAKENVKPLGRQIGKLSHSNPGVLFEYVLSQIQRYDNFIGPVVDSLKYLTSLSYDALAYCIIEALANPERERMKLDDTNISLWLQSLANFSGTVFKKYQIELTGLLQYVANQLKACKSVDLLILREVIMKMAGIEISEEITCDQLEAMSGGELLRQEGGYFIQVRNTKKSSSRLKDTLQERRLAIPLCLLMAQQKYGIIFPPNKMIEDNRHLKLIGRLYDQCQDTFVQFVSFLSMQLSTDELSRRLPPIDQLIQTYNLNVESSFSLSRGLYASAINAKYVDLVKPDRKKQSQSQKKQSSQSQSQKTQHYIAAVDHVMNPLAERVAPIYPPKVWEDMSLQLFLTFWSLSLYDLQVPSNAYRRQVQALEQQLNAVEENKEVVQSKKKKEKEKMQSVIQKLKEEEERQQQHVNLVLARLKHEKDSWFVSKTQKHATMILQMCLFPRSCFTAPDAVYCAKFLLTIHSLKTPNFSSLICYDRIFTDITWPMTSCSENEAHRYGRFLCAVLDDISRWHADKSVYEKECFSHPGFVTVFRAPSRGQTNTVADQLDFENYRHVCHKWHHCLTKVMVHCLESNDFQQMRNALIVLTRVLPHYPKVIKLGQALERRIDRVCQQEKVKRPDLWAFAMGYAGQLKVKRKTWISEADFHKLDTDTNKAKSGSSNSVKQDPGKTAPSGGNSGRSVQAVKSEHSQGKERSSSSKDVKTEVTLKTERQSRGGDDSRGNGKGGEHSRSNSRGGDDLRNNSRGVDDMRGNSRGSDDGRNSGHGSGADSKGARGDRKEGGSHSDRKAEKERRECLKEAKDRGSPMLGREKEKGRDKEPREKEVRIKEESRESKTAHPKHRDRRDDQQMTPGHHDDRGHDDSRKEKFVVRSHSSDERESERDSERMTAGHRRSAEPSPKHIDERDMKRRKIEAIQAAKESPHNYHTPEPRDKTHKSPAQDRSIEKLKEKKDRAEKRREKAEEEEMLKDGKRHKSDDNIGKLSKVNGHEKLVVSKSKARSNEKEDIMNHSTRKSKKDSPAEKEKRSSEKYMSKKSSKHH